jgi:hypothetical protein
VHNAESASLKSDLKDIYLHCNQCLLGMEFNACLDGFQEAVLACRPRNIHTFAARYFRDEKAPSPEEAHAVHQLPFLLFSSGRFKNAATTIFCHHMVSGSVPRQHLDPAVVCDVIARMDMPALGLQSKSVAEVRQQIYALFPTYL